MVGLGQETDVSFQVVVSGASERNFPTHLDIMLGLKMIPCNKNVKIHFAVVLHYPVVFTKINDNSDFISLKEFIENLDTMS